MKLIAIWEVWHSIKEIIDKKILDDMVYDIRIDRKQEDTILDPHTIERKTIITITEKL